MRLMNDLRWRDRLRDSSANILDGMLYFRIKKCAKADVMIDGFKVCSWEDGATEYPGNAYWRVELTTGHATKILGKTDTREEAKKIAQTWCESHLK